MVLACSHPRKVSRSHQTGAIQIDEYVGALSGTILAEVELEREDQALKLQPWIIPEVTGDPRFRQSKPLRLSSQIPW